MSRWSLVVGVRWNSSIQWRHSLCNHTRSAQNTQASRDLLLSHEPKGSWLRRQNLSYSYTKWEKIPFFPLLQRICMSFGVQKRAKIIIKTQYLVNGKIIRITTLWILILVFIQCVSICGANRYIIFIEENMLNFLIVDTNTILLPKQLHCQYRFNKQKPQNGKMLRFLSNIISVFYTHKNE